MQTPVEDNPATNHADSDAPSGRISSARIPRSKALGYSVSGLRPCRNIRAFICVSWPLGGCARLGAFTPSLDVYGSYFPAWLICLVVGVILTVLVSLLGRVFDLSAMRNFGPLVPISLILIFTITTWFLFFAS